MTSIRNICWTVLLLTISLGPANTVAAGDILSAGWGLDDQLPAFPDCPESLNQDGLPVVLRSEVDNPSLDAGDFQVETASGSIRTPLCATLLPAQEENEDRTVLLIGDLGTQLDPPRWVRIVGELRAESGDLLGGAIAVPDFKSGPSLVMVESAALVETTCPADAKSAVRLIFSGGILAIDGDEPDATDLSRFSVQTLDGEFVPIDFSDLTDRDNNLELCLPTAALATRVRVAAETVADPNGDSNAATAATVTRSDDALRLAGIWFDPELPGDGFTITEGGLGTFVYFFGYDANGQRLWLASDVIRTEIFAGDIVSVALFEGTSGTFRSPGPTVDPWGTLTLTAQGCEAMRFDLDGADGVRTLNGVRLADDGQTCEDPEVSKAAPFQELYNQGVDRFLGEFSPASSGAQDDGIIVHSFAAGSGPLCFTGNEFSMSTRDGARDELMIFLQGGGVCGPAGCDAVESAGSGIPGFGLLNANDPTNPVAEYNLGYLPYCDGSFFTGDSDADGNGDGINDRFFRGIQNLSASLDVIYRAYPSPTKIVLAGNSAGGFGVHFALPLVRKLYPDVAVDVINDSGVGILPLDTMDSLKTYWNADSFFPLSCPTCIGADGHLTDYHGYQLAQDDKTRIGFISAKQDELLAEAIGGPAFEAELLQATAELTQAFPDRFRSLIADGTEHTFILRQLDYPIAGTTVRRWIADMLEGSESWVSMSD